MVKKHDTAFFIISQANVDRFYDTVYFTSKVDRK